MKNAYLNSYVPPERYSRFLRGNLLSISGYVIAALETFAAIHFGFTRLTYTKALAIALPVLTVFSTFTVITYIRGNLKVLHERIYYSIYLAVFLTALSLWIYNLDSLRILGIVNGIFAVTIVMAYTNTAQSLMLSLATLGCYLAATFLAIKFGGQQLPDTRETLLLVSLIPVLLLISTATDYLNKKSNALLLVKRDLQHLNQELTNANTRLRDDQEITRFEMNLASEIQAAVFMSKPPETTDWDIALLNRPCDSVTGDFYDFYSRDNSLKGITLCDVSGHGVAPALITILAKPKFYFHFNRCEFSRPGLILESVNTEITRELEQVDHYLTGALLRINGMDVEYVNAGHPDILHLQSSPRNIRIITDETDSFKGHPMGIPLSQHEYRSLDFKVSQGDFIILYTDGLIEVKNTRGEQMGIERLSEAALSFPGGSAESLLNHIMQYTDSFSSGVKPSDDITLIVAGKK